MMKVLKHTLVLCSRKNHTRELVMKWMDGTLQLLMAYIHILFLQYIIPIDIYKYISVCIYISSQRSTLAFYDDITVKTKC